MATAKDLQNALMKKPEILTAIADCRNGIAARFEQKGYGIDYRIERIGQHMESNDPLVALKSVDMASKLCNDEEIGKRPDSTHNYTQINLQEFCEPPPGYISQRSEEEALTMDMDRITAKIEEHRRFVRTMEEIIFRKGGGECLKETS